MKKAYFLLLALLFSLAGFSQNDSARTNNDAPSEKKQRRDAIIKQEEEGTLVYTRQNGFGIMLRSNGYGLFFEIGRRRTQRFTSTYSIELTEIKHPKEEKVQSGFSNPYIYGKINNFYQVKLGYGQQYILGNKGNKNGVAVIALAQGGISAGLLKPYYVTLANGENIKWNEPDSNKFLSAVAAAGFTKGWGEIKVQPGLYFKTALRLDLGRFNESVNAFEIGFSADYYFKKVSIMAPMSDDIDAVGPRNLFLQAHIAYVFGRRK